MAGLLRRSAQAAALLGLCLSAGPAPAQSPAPTASDEAAQPCSSTPAGQTPRILVSVTGARRIAGNITYTLYGDRPGTFLAHRGSIALERVTLTGPVTIACFAVSRPGIYAIAVYHDENDNHHFDRSLLGLPVEGYGFSNNPPIFMAPPSFAAARFTVGPGDTRLAIRLRY